MASDYRERCLEEKEEKCQVCGATDNIQVHHADGDRSNDDLENLIPLCMSCHAGIHNGSDEYEEWQELLLPLSERDHDKTLIQVSAEIHTLLQDRQEDTGAPTFNAALHEIFQEAGYEVSDPDPPTYGGEPANPFETQYTIDAVHQALRMAHPTPLTNQEVADQVGCSKATAHNKLEELNKAGEIKTKKVGARARVWWVTVEDVRGSDIERYSIE